jgi:hypothetical protein
MIERESYMDALVPDSTSPMDERLVPSWLQKEAAAEEDWETTEKKRLELSAQSRDFLRAFPAEAFAGVYKIDKSTNQKMVIKSPEDVLNDAYSWLDKKVKGDAKLARNILNATGLIDEIVTYIMSCFGAATKEEVDAETEKNIGEDDGQPSSVLRRQHESARSTEDLLDEAAEDRLEGKKESYTYKEPAVYKKASLERTKRIGSYGIMADEETVELYKAGNLLHKMATEDFGGFAIVADEIDVMETEADVTALFGVEEVVETPVVADLVGKKVVFASGTTKVSGTITAMEGDEGTIVVDGMDGVEVSIPVDKLAVAANDCCVAHLKIAKSKFCPDCGEKLGN